MRQGAKAPQAAGAIHSDFEKGFIRAEVISYADYVAAGGETQAKEAGKMRLEGADYTLQDGDILHVRFNLYPWPWNSQAPFPNLAAVQKPVRNEPERGVFPWERRFR